MFDKPKCTAFETSTCPFKRKPTVGMWAVDPSGTEWWGTDCVCYKTCPRKFKKDGQPYEKWRI